MDKSNDGSVGVKKFYKILGGGNGLIPCHGGRGGYPGIGKWTVPVKVNPCNTGYHICNSRQIRHWLVQGAVLWECEAKDVIHVDGKSVASSVMLTRRVGLLTKDVLVELTCRCAESLLHLVPKAYQLPCIWAIDAARRGAEHDELCAAYDATREVSYKDFLRVDSVHAAGCTAKAAESTYASCVWTSVALDCVENAALRADVVIPDVVELLETWSSREK